ncbi:MAG TPA: hypothetical protein VER96_20930 [Polyangiaceae bacterium]|nr:hypothetical protein [Polyangiaceae bacterium]
MAGAWQMFQECGWPSWLSLFFGIAGFWLSIVALVIALFRGRARVPLAWLALAVALVPAAVGALGMQLGRAKVDEVLKTPFVDASQRERIREVGYQEAGSCVAVGGVFSAPALLITLSALACAYALRRKDPRAL